MRGGMKNSFVYPVHWYFGGEIHTVKSLHILPGNSAKLSFDLARGFAEKLAGLV
jgi:hypothetical protein